MPLALIVGLLAATVIAVAGVAAILVWLKAQFPRLAQSALQQSQERLLAETRSQLALERQQGLSDLELKRQAIDGAIQGLEKQLTEYQRRVDAFDKDREQKFGRLQGELQRVAQANDQLQRTAANLAAVLGNSRIRGQWGQRMADDILRFCGLQEGIHYEQEKEAGSGRPDYTFLLPDRHRLFMDVKFPLDNYLRLNDASPDDQARYRDGFLKDVRAHLKEMEQRGYTAQSDHSVDYIVLFIPNEQVYGLLNEWMPELIDECLRKKMILCGPWTLYAVVRIIWQAWENYQFSSALQDVVKAIQHFKQDYEKFKGRFLELGALLDKARDKYQEITETSYRRLDQRIKRVEESQRGHEALPEPPPEPLVVEPMATGGSAHD